MGLFITAQYKTSFFKKKVLVKFKTQLDEWGRESNAVSDFLFISSASLFIKIILKTGIYFVALPLVFSLLRPDNRRRSLLPLSEEFRVFISFPRRTIKIIEILISRPGESSFPLLFLLNYCFLPLFQDSVSMIFRPCFFHSCR